MPAIDQMCVRVRAVIATFERRKSRVDQIKPVAYFAKEPRDASVLPEAQADNGGYGQNLPDEFDGHAASLST